MGSLIRPFVRVLLSVSGLILVAIVFEIVTFAREVPIQRGIDANTVRVTARFTEFVPGDGVFRPDVYVMTFTRAGVPIDVRLRSVPDSVRVGSAVCLEMDGSQPDNARVCGTRGSLDAAREGLFLGGALLAGTLAASWLLMWIGRRHQAAGDDLVRLDTPAIRRGQNVVLRPATVTRVAMVVLLAVGPGLIVGAVIIEQGGDWLWVAVVWGLTAIVAIRLWRARIRCTDGVVSVIQPFRRIQRIPAPAVITVGEFDYPAISWRHPSGELGIVTAFGFWMGQPALKSILRHHALQVATLRAWIAAHREPGVV
jgi:hypothetical protein